MGSDRISSYFTRNSLKPSLSVPCHPTASGRLRLVRLPGSIGILAAHEKATPSGTASAIGRTEGHLAVRTRRVHGAGAPRRSVIVDRRFVLARLRQRTADLNSAVLPVALSYWPIESPCPPLSPSDVRLRNLGRSAPSRSIKCQRKAWGRPTAGVRTFARTHRKSANQKSRATGSHTICCSRRTCSCSGRDISARRIRGRGQAPLFDVSPLSPDALRRNHSSPGARKCQETDSQK